MSLFQLYREETIRLRKDKWPSFNTLQQEFRSFTFWHSGLAFAVMFQHIHVRKFFQLRKRLSGKKVNELNHLDRQIGKTLLFLLHVMFLPEIK